MENRLRPLRAQRAWSQEDLAKRLEVSRQSINAIETGRYDPSLPLAFRIAARAARESRGGGASGSYLPLSTPWPSGDQTICEIALAAHSGITSSSGSRQSSEYCGWLETNLVTPVRSSAALIRSAGHSEK